MEISSKTGGPAFPITDASMLHRIGAAAIAEISDSAERDRVYIEVTAKAAQGMTLRDYFMAHAPAEPQQWFIPAMPPCLAVPSVKSLPEGDLRDELEDESSFTSQAAADWLNERDRLADLQATWQEEFRKQIYVQWPAAWADLMLEARK